MQSGISLIAMTPLNSVLTALDPVKNTKNRALMLKCWILLTLNVLQIIKTSRNQKFVEEIPVAFHVTAIVL